MQKALWSSVVTCALLVGCAAMYPRLARASTQQACASVYECIIPANVACTSFDGCELSVAADLIFVKGRG